MPHTESNIPQNIFYSAIKGEFLRITCSSQCFKDFIFKAEELLECTEQQGSKLITTGTSLRTILLAHPGSSHRFSVSCEDLLNSFSEGKL